MLSTWPNRNHPPLGQLQGKNIYHTLLGHTFHYRGHHGKKVEGMINKTLRQFRFPIK